ncbi:MAG: serine/threonine-protein phosphatase [Phycisphaerales bacterium]|nr:MAG: serine/threonine-protein phosphatase [Phycisphaerales bacterium]
MDELSCVELWGGNHSVDTEVKAPGLRGWLSSRPYASSARGGDVYYLSSCSDGALTRASVADVSGHGISVARLALRLRDMMRNHIETFDHASVLRALNSEFGEGRGDGAFATAILVSFYRDTGDFLYSLAGHPMPLWYSIAEKTWRFLHADDSCDVGGTPNLPLGVLSGTNYCQTFVQLAPGDVVILYTDGVVEAKNIKGEQFGFDNLARMVPSMEGACPEEICRRIHQGVDRHRGRATIEDDVTILALQRAG